MSSYTNFSAPRAPRARQDQPLPALPHQDTSYGGGGYSHNPNYPSDPYNRPVSPVSPVFSPFDDQNAYKGPAPAIRPVLPQYSSSYATDRHDEPSDPFTDRNAVPMETPQSQRKDPMSSKQYRLDNEGGLVEDRRSTRSKQKKTFRERYFSGRVTWVVYFFTLVQIAVFIAEIAHNIILTKSPIEIHPQFNPMIGPSFYVQINMGARYVACMRNQDPIQNAKIPLSFPCPNTTSTAPPTCSLSDLCGMGGVPNPHPGGSLTETPFPNQWWRFITPIFLHAGLIHISFNLLLQCTLGRDMEKSIGSLRFLLVYLSSGIFGFVLGGNFAATGIASTGCSGSLFGILALTLLQLLYEWRSRRNPVRDLLFIFVDIIIAFVLGLLPGLDNFSHIGGFLMGLVLGLTLLRSPEALSRRLGTDKQSAPPYTPVDADRPYPPNQPPSEGVRGFLRNPIEFLKGRRPLWWAWWLVRIGALIGVLVAFIVLVNNFYENKTDCKWCKYLSCLPISNWCDMGNLNITTTTTTSPNPAQTTSPTVLFARDLMHANLYY